MHGMKLCIPLYISYVSVEGVSKYTKMNVRKYVGAYRIRPNTSAYPCGCFQGVCDTPLHGLFAKFINSANQELKGSYRQLSTAGAGWELNEPRRGWTMLNRWWLPEGEHLRILVFLSFTDPGGVEPHMSSHILLIASSPSRLLEEGEGDQLSTLSFGFK